MEHDVAKKLIDSLEEVNKTLFKQINIIKAKCSEEEARYYTRELARVSGVIDCNIYSQIIKKYPDLDPLKEAEEKLNAGL